MGVLLAVLAALGFSAKALLVKLAYGYAAPSAALQVAGAVALTPITLLALRMLYALPGFAWASWRSASDPLAWRERCAVAVFGLLGYHAASYFDFVGLQHISAGLERLILFTYPTFTLMLEVVCYKRAVRKRELAALLLCYTGIAAAFAHDLQSTAADSAIWFGAGLVLLSAVCYAAYLVGSARMIHRVGSLRFSALSMLAASAGIFVQFLLTTPITAIQQPWQIHALAAAMALFSTVIPVFALSAAIRKIGATRVAMISMTGPFITMLLAWVVLQERIGVWSIFGATLVLTGVWLAGQKR